MTDFYTPQELADRWKVSAKTVLRMAESGDLASIRVGKKIRIPAHALSTVEGDTACINTSKTLFKDRATEIGKSPGDRITKHDTHQLAQRMRRLQKFS